MYYYYAYININSSFSFLQLIIYEPRKAGSRGMYDLTPQFQAVVWGRKEHRRANISGDTVSPYKFLSFMSRRYASERLLSRGDDLLWCCAATPSEFINWI